MGICQSLVSEPGPGPGPSHDEETQLRFQRMNDFLATSWDFLATSWRCASRAPSMALARAPITQRFRSLWSPDGELL